MTPKPKLPPVSRLVRAAEYRHLVALVQPSRELVVGCVGREECADNYRVMRADFPCYAIEFVAGGSGSVRLRRKRYPLGPGVVFIYGPAMAHEITSEPGRPLTKYFVDVFGSEVDTLMQRAGLKAGMAVQVLDVSGIKRIYDMMLAEGGRQWRDMNRVLTQLARLLIIKLGESFTPRSAQQTSAAASFERCWQYVHEHAAEVSTLRDLAVGVGLAPEHVCRLFRQFGHPPPMKYIMRRRIDLAAAELAATGCAVKTAALTAGFSDPYHFSRVFRRFMGMPPAEFSLVSRHRIGLLPAPPAQHT